MMRRRGGRGKQLLDYLKERKEYWKLKGEALDRSLWRPRSGRSYGHVVRHCGIKGKVIPLQARCGPEGG